VTPGSVTTLRGGKPQQAWSWAQWALTLLVPILVVAAIVVFLPGSAVEAEDTIEWDGNMTEVGLEVEADNTIAALGTATALEEEAAVEKAEEEALEVEKANNMVIKGDGSMNWDAYARSQVLTFTPRCQIVTRMNPKP
jgi:hypothetical protein